MKRILLIALAVVSPLIVYCQNISDSLVTDSIKYCFTELQVKEFIKAKIDLSACNSVLIKKDSIILHERKKHIELTKMLDASIERVKIEEKKSKKLKWGIGSASFVVGGLIIYM